MEPLVIIAAIVVVGLVAFIVWQRRRSGILHERYGPEYNRTVADLGRRRAESELTRRAQRVERFAVRQLGAQEKARFSNEWLAVQSLFVDDPEGAVTRGDALVKDVMQALGYPVADFEQRAADLSVHHGRVVDNYRAARVIAERHRRDEASTEDLRRAMVYYRELFVDLLEDREPAIPQAADRPVDIHVERDAREDATSALRERERFATRARDGRRSSPEP